MRRVVIQDDLREALIRPDSGFTTYISLLEKDFSTMLSKGAFATLSTCPACGHTGSEPDFTKWGVTYVRCVQCLTTYMTPRPTKEALDQFYEESEAIRYWYSEIAKPKAEARHQYITGPRARWVLETTSTYEMEHGKFVDFYSKYPPFLIEISDRGRFADVLVRRPMIEGVETSSTKIKVVEEVEEGSVSVASAFEVVERLFDPYTFVSYINQRLVPGGLLFLTTLSISGFDLSLLRGKARNLLPPTHITILSYSGIQSLMKRCGFEVVELSTPGRLDVAIVLDALQRDPEIQLPALIKSILLHRGEHVHEAFQDFLQQANLSSHVWIVGRKRYDPQ